MDIGANVGQFASGLRRLGYQGQIESFEPLPSAFMSLVERSAGDQLWRCHNVAVGPRSGKMQMNEAKFSSVSSFLPPTESYDRFFEIEGRGATHPTTVEMVRLADALADVPGDRLFLKTDTQGYDMQVLSGAKDFSRVVAIQSELAIVPLYDGTPSFIASLQRFADMGFSPSGFFPVVQDGDLRLIEVDGVFVNEDFAG